MEIRYFNKNITIVSQNRANYDFIHIHSYEKSFLKYEDEEKPTFKEPTLTLKISGSVINDTKGKIRAIQSDSFTAPLKEEFMKMFSNNIPQ